MTRSANRTRDPSVRNRIALVLAAASLAAAAPVPSAPMAVPVASPRPAGPVAVLLAITLARPLFSPNRRPPATATGRTPRLPRLTGTIVEAGGTRLALFAQGDPAQTLPVREGGRLQGLLGLGIAPGRVLADDGTGRVTILLTRDRDDRAPPAPVSAPVVMTKDPRSRATGNQDE